MKILAVGAHFDDIELGCGGSLLKWKEEGHEISIFVATKSGYNAPDGKPIRTDERARKEGEAAAKQFGAKLYCGDFPTFELEYKENLNTKILSIFNIVKPDLVLFHWVVDSHRDHRILSQSIIHCSRKIHKLLMYTSNWYLSEGSFNPRFFVDISKFIDQKIELVKIHSSEFDRTNSSWETFIRNSSSLYGLKSGFEYAEGFELLKWVEN